jgi:hypothetical protein
MAWPFIPATYVLVGSEDAGHYDNTGGMIMRALLFGLVASAPLLGFAGESYAVSRNNGANHAGPGHCGVNMFWQQGRCIDATHLEHRTGVPVWHMRKDMNWDEYILKYGTWKQ